MEKILLIEEVAAWMRVSVSTIRRWLSESRKGCGGFPLTFSPPGSKLLWRECDIKQYIESQNSSPVCTVSASPKNRRREDKDFQTRQNAARAALERHRKPK